MRAAGGPGSSRVEESGNAKMDQSVGVLGGRWERPENGPINLPAEVINGCGIKYWLARPLTAGVEQVEISCSSCHFLLCDFGEGVPPRRKARLSPYTLIFCGGEGRY